MVGLPPGVVGRIVARRSSAKRERLFTRRGNMLIERLSEEAQDDLLARGFSRRQMGRIAVVFGVGTAAAATMGRPAWASAGVVDPAPKAKVRIGANECWTGPFASGAGRSGARSSRKAIATTPHGERDDFIKAVVGRRRRSLRSRGALARIERSIVAHDRDLLLADARPRHRRSDLRTGWPYGGMAGRAGQARAAQAGLRA